MKRNKTHRNNTKRRNNTRRRNNTKRRNNTRRRNNTKRRYHMGGMGPRVTEKSKVEPKEEPSTIEYLFSRLELKMEKEKELNALKLYFDEIDKENGFEISTEVKLFGLQYCLKERDRLKDKIERKLFEIETNKEKEEYLRKLDNEDNPLIKDVLRFTIVIVPQLENPGEYISILQTITKYLDENNFKLHPQHDTTQTNESSGWVGGAAATEDTNDKFIKTLFGHFDTNRDGIIDYEELQVGLQEYGIPTTESNDLFTMVDKNNDKEITTNELKIALTKPDVPPSIQKLKEIVKIEIEKNTVVDRLFNKAKKGFEKCKNVFSELRPHLDQSLGSLVGGSRKVKTINRWDTTEAYKGINIVYIFTFDESSGETIKVPVEIQFHTVESIKKKQEMHDLYEKKQNLSAEETKTNMKLLSSFQNIEDPIDKPTREKFMKETQQPDENIRISENNRILLGL